MLKKTTSIRPSATAIFVSGTVFILVILLFHRLPKLPEIVPVTSPNGIQKPTERFIIAL
jgi:hypothetical protein